MYDIITAVSFVLKLFLFIDKWKYYWNLRISYDVNLTFLLYICSYRKYSYGTCKVLRISTWKMWELTHSVSYLKLSHSLRVTSLKSNCLGSLVNPDGATTSDWVPVVDQVLLMASVFLTYTAGVIPVRKKSFLKFPKNIYNDDVVSGTSSGR